MNSVPEGRLKTCNDPNGKGATMTVQKPLKIMYLNPLASSASYDPIFAKMAREHKLPQT
jgi:hypothetical protein